MKPDAALIRRSCVPMFFCTHAPLVKKMKDDGHLSMIALNLKSEKLRIPFCFLRA